MYHAIRKQESLRRCLLYPILRQTQPPTPKIRDFCSNHSTGSVGEAEGASSDNPYDIAIVGGGMVGMALACSLATKPLTKHLKVAIIDGNPSLGAKLRINKEDPPDSRVSTVTPSTIQHFKDVDSWNYVEQHRHAYFSTMQVWDYTDLGCTKYDARDVSQDALGCVVENKVLLNALWSRIKDSDFKTSLYRAKLSSLNVRKSTSPTTDYHPSTEDLFSNGRLAKLELCNGSTLYSKLVVGADGGNSRVRELAGFKTTGWSYSQNAVICTVSHSETNTCAWQRFLPSGPIALLPIGDNFSNIVWTMNPQEASECTQIDPTVFINMVNNAFTSNPTRKPFSLSQITNPPTVLTLVSQRMAFPLSLKHATNYVLHRVALAGDAAHTVHPLAGQGVNLGFQDAFALSKAVADAVAAGSDIGDASILKNYETERKPANMMMMGILDGFQKAYAADFGPLNIVRGAAFNAAQWFGPLKRSIISYASGTHKYPLFVPWS